MQSFKILIRRNIGHCRSLSRSSVSRQLTQPEVQSQAALQIPQPDGEAKVYDPKIEKLVSDISQLNLLEVSQLSDALKKRLNLPDAPVMAMGSFAMGAQPAPEEEEEVVPAKVQTSFTVKLTKYSEKQKVALIKEVKNLVEGMNLVQAKKFVESAPAVVKSDLSKDEAEKLKEALVNVGAEVEIV
ncbi:large ribosomal subunit protein bL12m [Bacillus rossius redtenbacheri]|uniref:large ribosomal subunit protein bL12m n=1 Tax=Bacillus rossius redtenbacheri TaxID=93214 RepID=UPI002FDCBF16